MYSPMSSNHSIYPISACGMAACILHALTDFHILYGFEHTVWYSSISNNRKFRFCFNSNLNEM